MPASGEQENIDLSPEGLTGTPAAPEAILAQSTVADDPQDNPPVDAGPLSAAFPEILPFDAAAPAEIEAVSDSGYEIAEITDEEDEYIVAADEEEIQPSLTSADIYTAIGLELRQRRELLSLSLDEIERHTHVRQRHLEAIESGDFDSLPSPVQARGMLNNYAGFLDLDADAILLRFADALQLQLKERHPDMQPEAARPPKKRRSILRRFLSGDLIVFMLLLGMIVAFIAWAIIWITGHPDETASELPPNVSTEISSNLTPDSAGERPVTEAPVTVTVAPEEVEATPDEVNPAEIEGNVQIAVFASERTWMRVVVDGEVAFEGRTSDGTVYEFAAEEQIEIVTGNAAALQITYQGSSLGPLGSFGEAVTRIYTVTGALDPTPTPVPTPTITPTPTRTPRPSATPRPSPTSPT